VKSKSFTRTPSDIFPTGVFELQVSFFRKNVSRINLTQSEDVANYVRDHVYQKGSIQYVEQFFVLLLDRRNCLYAYKQISSGGVSATYTDPKLIFQTALLCHATQIIMVHNHPSGNVQPSHSDIQMTMRIKEVGDLLELPIIDHVIVTEESYYSFADEGRL